MIRLSSEAQARAQACSNSDGSVIGTRPSSLTVDQYPRG